MIFLIAASAHALEIRGAVAGEINGDSNLIDGNAFTWNPYNFAGFDYDIDRDEGSETLTTTLTDYHRLSGDAPYGIIYEASNQIAVFKSAQLDMLYGKLRVASIDNIDGKITLDNKDNAITLSKNKDIELMPGIYLRAADNDTLRYYIYKEVNDPGTYEIRGAVAGEIHGASNLDPTENSFIWSPQNFAGFYYDIKKDIGTETLKFVLTGDNKLSGDSPDYGVTYTTTAQNKAFERALWGSYKVIGFQAEKYFAGYNEGVDEYSGSNIFYKESTDKNSLSSEQLEKILIDEKTKTIVKKGESIKLKEGYELLLKGVSDGGKIFLELRKDGESVDEAFAAPSRDSATEFDKTYYYRNPGVGEQRNLVTIGVHFMSTYKDEEQALALVDGLWQISAMPVDVKADTQYDKMTIRSVDANNGVITMDNKDNAITLNKKRDIVLMPGLNLRTADNETLRFYIYKTETIAKT
ncbi:MAG: S-layer protein domain-containing protein [Methanothrix sp.]|nr:S-layer protein domain-containing protein [Methanothrix sp.]